MSPERSKYFKRQKFISQLKTTRVTSSQFHSFKYSRLADNLMTGIRLKVSLSIALKLCQCSLDDQDPSQ